MAKHDYTAEQALEVLMRKVRERDEILARDIQSAIDAGKDVQEEEPSYDRRRRSRIYRKTVPFTYEEALEIALKALQAYFVEQPLFVESASESLAASATANARGRFEEDDLSPSDFSVDDIGKEKPIEVELQTETQITKSEEETFLLKPMQREEIGVQHRNIARLHELINFDEDNGHSR